MQINMQVRTKFILSEGVYSGECIGTTPVVRSVYARVNWKLCCEAISWAELFGKGGGGFEKWVKSHRIRAHVRHN
jgi:hypothetical protein